MNRDVIDPIVKEAKIHMMSDARLEEFVTLLLNEAYQQVSMYPNLSPGLSAKRMLEHFGVKQNEVLDNRISR